MCIEECINRVTVGYPIVAFVCVRMCPSPPPPAPPPSPSLRLTADLSPDIRAHALCICDSNLRVEIVLRS